MSLFPLIFALGAPAHAQEVCTNDLTQDLNCNGIEVMNEEAVDLSDPLCLSNVDEDGVPYANADYYVEYQAFGCLYNVENKGNIIGKAKPFSYR